MEETTKIISFQFNIFNLFEKLDLERTIKSEVSQLLRELRGLNLVNLRGVATNTANIVLDQVESLQRNILALADKALASSTPGSVINEAFLNLKQGLGRALINFQNKTEADILQFIRDTMASLQIRNLRGDRVESLYVEARDRITNRINQIVSMISRTLKF